MKFIEWVKSLLHAMITSLGQFFYSAVIIETGKIGVFFLSQLDGGSVLPIGGQKLFIIWSLLEINL